MQVLSLEAAKYRRCTYLDKGRDLFIVTIVYCYSSPSVEINRAELTLRTVPSV